MATHLASLYDRLGGGPSGSPPPVLASDRLELRPLRRADAGPIALYAGEARVARMTATLPHPYPPGAALAFVEGSATMGQGAVWAIDGSRAGLPELVGTIGLRRPGTEGADIGCWIAPPFWNRGLAREAVRAVLAAGLFDAPTRGVVFRDDPASARVLEAAGFRRMGEARVFSVARGEAVAAWVYVHDPRHAD